MSIYTPYGSDDTVVNVVHKTTREYKVGVNSSEFSLDDWVHNPDADLIESDYWTVSGVSIVEMTQEEKDAWDIQKDESVCSKPVITLSLHDNQKPYTRINSMSYTTIQQIIFPGVDNLGKISRIKVVAWLLSSGESLSIRIEDISNEKSIASKSNEITSTVPTTYDLGTVTNLPNGLSIWEIQAKVGASSCKGAISSVIFYG